MLSVNHTKTYIYCASGKLQGIANGAWSISGKLDVCGKNAPPGGIRDGA